MEFKEVIQFIKSNLISILSLFVAFFAFRNSRKIQKSRINCLLRAKATRKNLGQVLITIKNLGPGYASNIKVFSIHPKADSIMKKIRKYRIFQFEGPNDLLPNTEAEFEMSEEGVLFEQTFFIEWDDLLFNKNRKFMLMKQPLCADIKGLKKMFWNIFRILKIQFKFKKPKQKSDLY